jgi:hypothetical protein
MGPRIGPLLLLWKASAIVQDTSDDTSSQYIKIYGASHPTPAFCIGNSIFVKTPQMLQPWHYRPVYKYIARTTLGHDATKLYDKECIGTHAELFWQDDYVRKMNFVLTRCLLILSKQCDARPQFISQCGLLGSAPRAISTSSQIMTVLTIRR